MGIITLLSVIEGVYICFAKDRIYEVQGDATGVRKVVTRLGKEVESHLVMQHNAGKLPVSPHELCKSDATGMLPSEPTFSCYQLLTYR